MNEPVQGDYRSPTHAEQGGIEADPGHLSEREARLVRGLQRALADGSLDMETFGQIDLNELARRLAARSEATKPRHARLDRWMIRLDRRMRQVESRLEALTNRAVDQQEAIGMICAILRDLDDPYGFGLSLDERLACDGADRTTEEEV
jgi:hypothetical protein